jgi:predicted anti-sigma-YlaC factor YlaD
MSTERSADLSCEELVKVVTDYLEGSMPREQRTRFETHLCYCPPCRLYLAQMEETVTVTGRLTATAEDLPAGSRERLLAAFRGWNRDPRGRKP